jgi:hypothetical protein
MFNKYKIKKQIGNEFAQTLEAVTEYIEDYEFLQEVLTENGYSMMVDNILNGNTLYLKLLLKTLDNYVEFRDFAIQNGYNDTLTVERKDVNGNYEPNNITFIPSKLQARNTRQNVKITYKGLTLCAAEWAEILECNADTLTKRKRNGWNDDKTLETLINGNEKMIDISLVPTEIIEAIKQVRIYGCQKYGDPNNWKTVEKERYIDAMYRHLLEYVKDNKSIDEESGLPHLWHLACNVAFLCELDKGE